MSGIVLFVGIIIGIIGFLHVVVYKALVSIFAISVAKHLIVLRVLFLILTFCFIGATILSSRFDTVLSRFLYTLSSYWMGLLFYLFLVAIMYALAVVSMSSFHGGGHLEGFGKALVLLVVLVCAYGAYHANDVKVVQYEVSMPNLPEEWKGKKAVLVADLHLGHIRGKEFAGKVASMINEQNPEIVFIAGDLYDGVKVNEKDVVLPLKNIKAPWGTYFAPGNHEEMRGSANAFFEGLTNVGVIVLRDEKREVRGVDIIGADYETTNNAEEFKAVLEKVEVQENPAIMIKHVPLNLEVAEEVGIDLAVSGHTHQGQVFPASLITRSMYKGYDHGRKAFGKMTQITTSGVGTWGPPYRVGTQSEIVVITFR